MTEIPPVLRWDERYNGEDYLFGTEPNDFLVSVAPRLPTGAVLCLADDEGRNGVYLAGGHAGHAAVVQLLARKPA